MNEHLFIGDTTYPHLAKSTNENICEQLRELSPDLVEHHAKQIVFAIDRIEQLEQLERQLIEAQKGHARYEFMRKLTPQSFNTLWFNNLTGKSQFDDLVDAAMREWTA